MAFSALNTPTSLSPDDADELRRTAKWARLVAVLGFVMLGLLLMLGITYGLILRRAGAMPGSGPPFDATICSLGFMALFLLSAIIYFFPLLFLYRYASRTARALSGPFDASGFSVALRSHRSFYGYVGVLAIVTVLGYAVMAGAVLVAFVFTLG